VREVNKKIIAVVLLLSLFSILAGSIVFVEGEQKETLSYYEVHVPLHEDPYFEISIPDAKGTKTFSKICCDVPAYVINIGGDLVYPVTPDIGEFDGGTNYILDRDFTYEGTMFWMTQWCFEENSWIYVMQVDRCVIYTFTESEASIHKIDGTLEFYERQQISFTQSGSFIGGESIANGYGTGDLKGATMKATMGPLTYTEETGIQWATLQGTIKGWPTHLNKP